MVKKTRHQDLDRLRSEIRNITLDILARVHRRMELAEQIGSIKDNLNIEIEDEEVEQDVRRSVSELSQTLGIDPAFSGRLLNMLLMESIRLQQIQQRPGGVHLRPTHLSVFMKAKDLETSGKKIIHLEVGEPDYAAPKKIKKLSSNHTIINNIITPTPGE